MKNPLINAFQISIEDIQQVALNHRATLTDEQAEVALKLLDQNKIASVALDGGDDLDTQTTAAYGEIKRQMIALKQLLISLLNASDYMEVDWKKAKKTRKLQKDREARKKGPYVTCSICKQRCVAHTAHIHQGEWIGDECCWDERLRSSE